MELGWTPVLRKRREAATTAPPASTWDTMNRAAKRNHLRLMPRSIRKSVFGRWRWRQTWHMEEREAAMNAAKEVT